MRVRSGLVKPRTQFLESNGSCSGFTVIELLIVLAVFMTLMAIAIPNLLAAKESSQYARAVADIRTIGGQVMVYRITHDDTNPDSLADIGYGSLKDPWGNPYEYLDFADTKGKGKMRKDHF